jgi:hypothetical protein
LSLKCIITPTVVPAQDTCAQRATYTFAPSVVAICIHTQCSYSQVFAKNIVLICTQFIESSSVYSIQPQYNIPMAQSNLSSSTSKQLTRITCKTGQFGHSGMVSNKGHERKRITCTTCLHKLPDAHFDEYKLKTWRTTHGSYRDSVCSECCSDRPAPFGRHRKTDKFTCQQLGTEKDARLYGSKDINRHTREGTESELVCLYCSPSRARHLNNNSYACTRCAKLLPRDAFSVVMQKCRDYKKWQMRHLPASNLYILRRAGTHTSEQVDNHRNSHLLSMHISSVHQGLRDLQTRYSEEVPGG